MCAFKRTFQSVHFSKHTLRMLQIHEAFQNAINDYRFLLDKGYPVHATLKLVGDRYRLNKQERMVLFRGILDSTMSMTILRRILSVLPDQARLGIDGYNVLFTLINYRRGHPLFIATDGLLRDVGGAYGRIEREEDFQWAIQLLATWLCLQDLAEVTIFLDAPVSHSGEHRSYLKQHLQEKGIPATVYVADSADPPLKTYTGTAVASSDSTIAYNATSPIFDLARAILEQNYHTNFTNLSMLLKMLPGSEPAE